MFRSLLQRLYVDGLIEVHNAKTRREKFLWWLIIILCYSCVISFSILTVQRYQIGTTVILVEHIPLINRAQVFLMVTVCHTANWNKTYFEKTIIIPETILLKAKSIGITRSQLLAEFAKYINLYTVGDFNQVNTNLWSILTEIFEHNFRDAHFADFVADAAFRGRELFRNCIFSNYKYPCKSAHIVLDMPSCYTVPVKSRNFF